MSFVCRVSFCVCVGFCVCICMRVVCALQCPPPIALSDGDGVTGGIIMLWRPYKYMYLECVTCDMMWRWTDYGVSSFRLRAPHTHTRFTRNDTTNMIIIIIIMILNMGIYITSLCATHIRQMKCMHVLNVSVWFCVFWMRIAFTDFDVGLVCVRFCYVGCPLSFHALCSFTIDELRDLGNFVWLLLFIVSQFIWLLCMRIPERASLKYSLYIFCVLFLRAVFMVWYNSISMFMFNRWKNDIVYAFFVCM